MTQYWRAIPSLDPARSPAAKQLAGTEVWFDRVECLSRSAAPCIVAAENAPPEVIAAMTAPRAALGPLSLDVPRLMGVLNTTPDSFSDGGDFIDPADAVARARAMIAEGADLVDIGGESTRPGAEEVAVDVEVARTAPVIAALQAQGQEERMILSLDTRKAAVARAGRAAGVDILNDVSGLRFDPDMARTAAETGAPLILMHSLATPETMQAVAKGAYDDVLLDVYDGLRGAIATAEAAGVARDKIVVDPGIGFGKTEDQNLALIRRISLFHSLGCPILLGVSRKGFIGTIGAAPEAAKRGAGSVALGLWGLSQGVQILRIHDIAMHKQAIALWRAAHISA